MIKQKALWNISCRKLGPAVSEPGDAGWSVARGGGASSAAVTHADGAVRLRCITFLRERRNSERIHWRVHFPGEGDTDIAPVTWSGMFLVSLTSGTGCVLTLP